MIQDLFLSIEQVKHLQLLGLDTSDAVFSWIRFVRKSRKKKTSKWKVRPTTAKVLNRNNVTDLGHYEGVPTYTLQELLTKFPPKYHDRVIAVLKGGVTMTYGQTLEISRCTGAEDEIFYGFHYGYNLLNGVTDPNPLQAAYKMLLWVLGQGKEEKK